MQIISLPIALNARKIDSEPKLCVKIILKIPYFAFHGDHYPQDIMRVFWDLRDVPKLRF